MLTWIKTAKRKLYVKIHTESMASYTCLPGLKLGKEIYMCRYTQKKGKLHMLTWVKTGKRKLYVKIHTERKASYTCLPGLKLGKESYM